MSSSLSSSCCSLLCVVTKRLFVELFLFCSAVAYLVLWPIFWLIKKCPPLANRWYSLFMAIIYLLMGRAISGLREKTFENLYHWKSNARNRTDENEDTNKKAKREANANEKNSQFLNSTRPVVITIDDTMNSDVHLPGECKILEVGPGFGDNFQYYPKGTKLTTIEINDYMERNRIKFQENFPNITFEENIIGNVEIMDTVPNETFDIVIGTQVFCCINDMESAIKEINRVLKPNGLLFFLENVQHEPASFKYYLQKLYSYCYQGYSLRCHAGCFDVQSLIESNGFKVVEVTSDYNPRLPTAFSRFDYGCAIKK